MVNISKYKLIEILTGIAATSYGSYEIYNQFGPSNLSNLNSQQNPEALDDEEFNEDLESNDEQPLNYAQDSLDGNVVNQPEALPPKVNAPLENLKSKQDLIPAPKTPEKPQKRTRTIRTNQLKEGAKKSHLDENENIKILPNTIGNRFQSDVITAKKDDPVGGNKVNAGSMDLNDYAENKNDIRGLRNPIPDGFVLRRGETADAEHLQRKCAISYRKKTGSDPSIYNKEGSHNRDIKIRQYGAIVGKYCGKADRQSPKEGHSG